MILDLQFPSDGLCPTLQYKSLHQRALLKSHQWAELQILEALWGTIDKVLPFKEKVTILKQLASYKRLHAIKCPILWNGLWGYLAPDTESYGEFIKKMLLGTNGMVQWVTMLAMWAWYLSSIPGTYLKVERGNQLHKVSLWPPHCGTTSSCLCTLWHTQPHRTITNTQQYNNQYIVKGYRAALVAGRHYQSGQSLVGTGYRRYAAALVVGHSGHGLTGGGRELRNHKPWYLLELY